MMTSQEEHADGSSSSPLTSDRCQRAMDTDQRRNLGRNREAQASRSRLAARLDLATKSFNTGRVWLRFPF